MNAVIFSVIVSISLFTWAEKLTTVPPSSNKNDRSIMDEEIDDPVFILAEVMHIYRAMMCREGFSNISEPLIDAAYHCANLKHKQVSHLKFSEETADIEGPTPVLCLRACVLNQTGLVSKETKRLNETALLRMLILSMRNPGGSFSAFLIAKEMMDCDKKHKESLPSKFLNCSGFEEFFKCTRKVLVECNGHEDKRTKYNDQFMKFLEDHPRLFDEYDR